MEIAGTTIAILLAAAVMSFPVTPPADRGVELAASSACKSSCIDDVKQCKKSCPRVERNTSATCRAKCDQVKKQCIKSCN
ncbi:MAG: hypothetical protein AB3N20_11690 [Rhizobiaceae bacterium]